MNGTRTIAFTLALTLAASLVPRTGATSVSTAEILSAYPLKTLAGVDTPLSSFHGEVVVVNFWASWCAPCQRELPLMNEWDTSWKGRGARVVAVSVDGDARKAERFVENARLSLTVMHDGPEGLARTLDLPSLPCTFLLDREGNVVSVLKNSSASNLAELRRKVDSMIGGAR